MSRSVFKFSTLFSGLLITLLLAGCASSPDPVHYYTLKPMTDAKPQQISHTIGIQPIVTPSWLDRSKISWNDGNVSLVVLDHDRWAGPLSKLINQTMLRNFSRIYPDAFVSLGPWLRSSTPERVVAIQIMALERANNELTSEFAITISDNKRNVRSNSFKTYQHPLNDSRSASQFAEAFGIILGQMNQDIALQLAKIEKQTQ